MMSRTTINILLLLAVVVIMLIAGEIAARAMPNSTYQEDARYGWARRDQTTVTAIVQDEKNVTRDITVYYHHAGFKRWGDNTSNRTKVLIIGDSYTEMRFVNNGEEWYSYLERAYPDAEFFVYGTGGFGSLQEYLVLDEYYEQIDPDIIIWQFYFNDFTNNMYYTDRQEYPLNNHGMRPYLENGTIVHRLPVPFAGLREHSLLAAIALDLFDKQYEAYWQPRRYEFFNRLYGEVFWRDFSNATIFQGRISEVEETTTDIFKMARARAGETPIYLFSADSRLATYESRICENADIAYIPGIAEFIADKNMRGKNMYVVGDGHWNLAGNKEAGEYLVRYFEAVGAFRDAETRRAMRDTDRQTTKEDA